MSDHERRLARRLLVAVVVCVAAGGCGASNHAGTVIKVTPASGLFDQARAIVISHLAPAERVTVTSRSLRPSGTWSASATFRANRAGVVDLAHSVPISGSYSGVSPMGLLWSQQLSSNASGPLNGITVTTLTVIAGTRRLASTRVTQRLDGPGVTEKIERLSQTGFLGRYFAPPGRARRPAVVLWGGSEGGLGVTVSEAALLASHGIPALAVAYFNEPGLPCRLESISLEYFVRAIRWLRSQPQVNPDRVWILSGSRGTEAELLVAAHWPTLMHGVVGEAPSSFVNGDFSGNCPTTGVNGLNAAWTLNGKPLANNKRIPVKQITGAVLVISGGADTVWPSGLYADQITAALPHNSAAHVHLNYPDAGHIVLSIPFTPSVSIDGGTPAANEAAHASDWPASLHFITSH